MVVAAVAAVDRPHCSTDYSDCLDIEIDAFDVVAAGVGVAADVDVFAVVDHREISLAWPMWD
jgi:hypothetical protein